MTRLTTVIVAAVAALVVATAVTIPAIGAGPFTAERSASKDQSQDRQIRSLKKQLKRLGNTAKQGVGQSEEAIDRSNKMEKVVSDAAWDVRREIQVVNGRVSSLPPSPKDNKVHEYGTESSTIHVPANVIGGGSARCPDDMSPWSGGFGISNNLDAEDTNPVLIGERIIGQEYVVEFNNLDAPASGPDDTVPFDLDVYVYCVPK